MGEIAPRASLDPSTALWCALPREPIRWQDPRLRGAWWALLTAAVVACAFLPGGLTINDEYFYAGQAYLLAHGRIAAHVADPLGLPGQSLAEAFRYPFAWPLVLALGRTISLRAMYVAALTMHLCGGAALARMLVRRGILSVAVGVYLFHPVFWTYSRTLMSDVPATAALLVAMDAWENRTRSSMAAALGFASVARITGIVSVLGFAFALGRAASRRELLLCALGITAFWGVQCSITAALGNGLLSPYASAQTGFISSGLLLENGLLYLGGLALLPPFSLGMAVWRRALVDRWAWLGAVVVLAYLPVAYHERSLRIVETLVGGQRYVMAAHAALLIATARVWGRAPMFRHTWPVLAIGAACGVFGSLAVSRLEQRHRPAIEAVRACHPNELAYDTYSNRIAGSVESRSYHAITWPRSVDPAWDVLVLAPGFQSNQPGYSSSWNDGPPRIPGAQCSLVGPYAIYDFRGRCRRHGEACWAPDRSNASPRLR
jgi:hypothetical protein